MSSIIHSLDNKVCVAAHRGHWTQEIPENSIGAIENAIKIGCDIVEVDIRRTLDGHFVLIHDEYLDRTTNGYGKVSEYTLEELNAFNLLNTHSDRPSEYKIPTLKEALMVAKNKVVLCLDKGYEYIHELFHIVDTSCTNHQVIFKGFHSPQKAFQDYGHLLRNGRIAYMPIINLTNKDADEWIFEYLQLFNPFAMEFLINKKLLCLEKVIRKVLKKGVKIWLNPASENACNGFYEANGENPENCWQKVINLGGNILNTDLSDKMLSYLRLHELHK